MVRRQVDRLIWDLDKSGFWLVMPLIDQHCTAVFESISVRSIRSHRHQNNRVIPAKTKIHPALKVDAFSPAHFVMRNNVIQHTWLSRGTAGGAALSALAFNLVFNSIVTNRKVNFNDTVRSNLAFAFLYR